MIDLSPAEVRGPGMRAHRARVFWVDGWLYICISAKDVRRFQTPEPTPVNSRFQSGPYTFWQRGCNCSNHWKSYGRSTLMAMAGGTP